MSKRYNPRASEKVFKRTMILLGLLTLTACTYMKTMITTPPVKEQAYAYVCYNIEQMYDVGCGDLEAPMVVYSPIIDAAAGYGRWHGVYYHGDKYIFINPGSPKATQDETLLHETTHYVLYNLELIPDNETCEHERVARLISGGKWGDRQKKAYGCVK